MNIANFCAKMFNMEKLNGVEVNAQYQALISSRLASLEHGRRECEHKGVVGDSRREYQNAN
jgi:hypothetical protein